MRRLRRSGMHTCILATTLCIIACTTAQGPSSELSGNCEDVGDGDARLGGLASCTAAITAAGGDCSRLPNSDAASVPDHCSWTGQCGGGCQESDTCVGEAQPCHNAQEYCEGICSTAEYPGTWCSGNGGNIGNDDRLIGELCPRSCGWCAQPDEFLKFENIATPYCAHHEPAYCLPISGLCDSDPDSCGGSAVDDDPEGCMQIDITSQPHPVSAAAACTLSGQCRYTLAHNSPPGCSPHPFTLSVQEVAWLTSNGRLSDHINARTVLAQGLNGEVATDISREDLVGFGMSFQQASAFMALRDMLFRHYPPGLRVEASRQLEAQPQMPEWIGADHTLQFLDVLMEMPFASPHEVEAAVVFERLLAVSEIDYTFEAEFTVMLCWLDETIFRTCTSTRPWRSADEDESSSIDCPEVWRPEIRFLNAKAVDGATLQPMQGSTQFFAHPYGWESELGTGVAPATAFIVARYSGQFTAPMSFQKFPADIQTLPIELHLNVGTAYLMREQIQLSPQVALGEHIEQRMREAAGTAGVDGAHAKDTLSGWNIVSAEAREFASLDWSAAKLKTEDGGGAFEQFVDVLTELGVDVDRTSTVSGAGFSLVVERKSAFFLQNYVISVCMLTAVSWLTFWLDPMDLSARAGVALTLLLAIGVFQLILNETMPQTGYLTPMHIFILTSTVYVVLAVVESLLIYQLRKRKAVKEAVVRKFHGATAQSGEGGGKGLGVFKQRVAAAPSAPSPPLRVQQQERHVQDQEGPETGRGLSLDLPQRMAGGAQQRQQVVSGDSPTAVGLGAKYTVGPGDADLAAGTGVAAATPTKASMEPGISGGNGSGKTLSFVATSLDLDEIANSYGLDVHMGDAVTGTNSYLTSGPGGSTNTDGGTGGDGSGRGEGSREERAIRQPSCEGEEAEKRRGRICLHVCAAVTKQRSVDWLTEHLDTVSLVVFPVSYAIFTAMLFA